MEENVNKNAKVEQLTIMILRIGEEKTLIVKDPFKVIEFYNFETLFFPGKVPSILPYDWK